MNPGYTASAVLPALPLGHGLGDGAGPLRLFQLPGDDVHVWTVPLNASPDCYSRLQRTLSDDEVARAARFRFERDANRFVAARGVLRTLLACYLEAHPAQLHFEYGPKGKPALSATSAHRLQFNLAHSADLVICAFTQRTRMGVDVEQSRAVDDAEDLSRRFFAAAEHADLMSLPAELRSQAFLACWTRKEAFVKALGDGLSLPLQSFRVSLLPGMPAALLDVDPDVETGRQWFLYDFQPLPGFVAAVAAEGRARPLRAMRVQSLQTLIHSANHGDE